MKTIQEACEASFIYHVNASDPTSIRQANDKIQNDNERTRSFDDDVRNCRYIQFFVANMVAMVTSGRVPLGEVIMATCCQMIQVGMAMHAPELPDPEKSVPGRRERPEGYTGV